MDLSNFYNAMLALKMQIRTIEAQAAAYMSSEEDKSLRQDVERWKLAWRDAESRLDSRRHLYEHSSQEFLRGTDTGTGNGMSSSMHSSVTLSPPVYRSKLTIKRPGLTSKALSDPFIEQQSKPSLDDQFDQRWELKDEVQEPLEEGAIQRKDSKVEEYDDNEQAIISDDEETLLPLEEEGGKEEEEEEEESQEVEQEAEEDCEAAEEEESDTEELPRKSAWQELWDGLSEYAGILDYSD